MAEAKAAARAGASILTRVGVLTARPAAFLIVVAYAVGWAIFQPHTFDWHGVATIATWLMTLFIQRAEHRDTQAIQIKLDEILRALPGAPAAWPTSTKPSRRTSKPSARGGATRPVAPQALGRQSAQRRGRVLQSVGVSRQF